MYEEETYDILKRNGLGLKFFNMKHHHIQQQQDEAKMRRFRNYKSIVVAVTSAPPSLQISPSSYWWVSIVCQVPSVAGKKIGPFEEESLRLCYEIII